VSIKKSRSTVIELYCKPNYYPDLKRTQLALDSLVNWSNTWQLSLAVPKCGCLSVKNNAIFSDDSELFFSENSFRVLHKVVDLVVTIDSKLSFDSHIDGVIFKAKRRIDLLFKSFVSRNVSLFIFAYKTYFLPILDHCSSVWSPDSLTKINKLETVQRFYNKRLDVL